ncbi:MAG TPA: hypothetical protein VED59_07830, partial [Acidimicrobiales bacterium]|nr:hypothetical protein [Acidimicrobiales bacterium]
MSAAESHRWNHPGRALAAATVGGVIFLVCVSAVAGAVGPGFAPDLQLPTGHAIPAPSTTSPDTT